jgi:hypothetical protein
VMSIPTVPYTDDETVPFFQPHVPPVQQSETFRRRVDVAKVDCWNERIATGLCPKCGHLAHATKECPPLKPWEWR